MTSLFIDIPHDFGTMVLIAAAVLGATVLSVIAGFGFGTVLAPILVLLLPPSAAVAVIKIAGTGTGWIALVPIWRHVRWQVIVRILPAAVVGLVVGGIILREAEPALIQLGVGLLVLISAVTMIVRPILISRDALWLTSLIGFITGVIGNATGLLAPAVVIYFTGRRFARDVFRATTLMLFLAVDLVGLPTLALQGAVSLDDLQVALAVLPVAIAGRLLGVRLVHHVSQLLFRRITMAVLVVMAAVSIVSAIDTLS